MPPLSGALIGFGRVAEGTHLPSYGGDFQVTAIVEPDPDRRLAARRLLPGVRVFPSTAELWSGERPDFVDVCSPPVFHAAAVLEALDHGVHVLCEKPLVTAERDLDAIRRRAAGRVVYCVDNWKYSAQLRKVFAVLPNLGEVRRFDWSAERSRSDPGAAAGASPWRTHPRASGGGILFDHGWHAVYLALSIVGRAPRAVSADAFRQSSPGGVEEEVSMLLHFEGAQARLRLSWRSSGRYNGGMIEGTRGTLVLDDNVVRTEEACFSFAEPLSRHSTHPEWFPPVLSAFREEIENPGKRGANLEEAALCFRALEAAAVSGREGGKVVEL
jgi:predicted dehydrogenase